MCFKKMAEVSQQVGCNVGSYQYPSYVRLTYIFCCYIDKRMDSPDESGSELILPRCYLQIKFYICHSVPLQLLEAVSKVSLSWIKIQIM